MDKFKKFNGYVSAATTIISGWLLPQKKALEILPRPMNKTESLRLDKLDKFSRLFTLIGLATTVTYQYDKYLNVDKEGAIVKDNTAKWLIYGFGVTTVGLLGFTFYKLVKQESVGSLNAVSNFASRYLLPIGNAFLGITHIVLMSLQSDFGKIQREKTTPYRIIHVTNSLLCLSELGPIDDQLKKDPRVYGAVHLTRGGLKMLEGGILGIELAFFSDENAKKPKVVIA